MARCTDRISDVVIAYFYRKNPKVLYTLSLSALILIVITSVLNFVSLVYKPSLQLISITAFIPNLDQDLALQYINQIWLIGCIVFVYDLCGAIFTLSD